MNWGWLRYSGISVKLNLNPCHWYLIPFAKSEHNSEWGSPWRSWRTGWICLTIQLFLDDGSW
jgi:hypothetical protein